MPPKLTEWLNKRSLLFHFGVALTLGFLCRLITAYVSYGPLALDDYLDAIAPAIQRFQGLPSPVNPGRSYFIVWLLTGVLEVGSWLGISDSAVSQVRLAYSGLGLFSLLTIVGGYFYVRNDHDQVFGALTLYLFACYALMPLASTRAFGEAVSMSWVMMGVGLGEWAKSRNREGIFFLAMLFMGIGVLFRYQSGLLFLSYLACLVYEKRYRLLFLALLAGVISLGGEIVSDLFRNRYPLETFFVYLKRNEGSAAIYGIQPWYVFLVVLLAASFFPFSATLFPYCYQVVKKHFTIAIGFVVFVVAHSLILHKEERFLFPILPWFLVLLAAAWARGRDSFWVRRTYFPAFFFLNSIGLLLVMGNNSQGGLIEPVVLAQERADSGLFLEIDTDIHSSYLSRTMFLRKDFSFLKAAAQEISLAYIEKTFQQNPTKPLLLVISMGAVEALKPLVHARTGAIVCGPLEQRGSLADQVIYYFNPKYNGRRRPVYFVQCNRRG